MPFILRLQSLIIMSRSLFLIAGGHICIYVNGKCKATCQALGVLFLMAPGGSIITPSVVTAFKLQFVCVCVCVHTFMHTHILSKHK